MDILIDVTRRLRDAAGMNNMVLADRAGITRSVAYRSLGGGEQVKSQALSQMLVVLADAIGPDEVGAALAEELRAELMK